MDLPDKLSPAKTVGNENQQKLSHEDFQKLLSGWFENSGLITETRSYLRMQLIRTLNTTKLGLQGSRPREPVSQTVQILNMLVAEHLLRYKYLYTLSMFSNEMSTLSVPPEFNFLFLSDHGDGPLRFEKNQVLRILNFLNAPLRRENIEDILSAYYNNGFSENGGTNGNSLLLCLLGNFCASVQETPNIEDVDVISVMEHLRHLLSEIEAPHHIIHGIEKAIKRFILNLERRYASKTINKSSASRDRLYQIQTRDIGTQKSFHRRSSANAEEMRLIALHNQRSKMIKRIYKYRVSQIEKVQNQLMQKLNEFDKPTEKCPLNVQKCALKHCGENCEETRCFYDKLKLEYRELNDALRNRNEELEILEMKLAKMSTALVQAQNKITISSHKMMISLEDDTNTGSEDRDCVDPKDNTKDKTEPEVLEILFQDVYRKLDDLENENEMIDTEYKLFKNTVST